MSKASDKLETFVAELSDKTDDAIQSAQSRTWAANVLKHDNGLKVLFEDVPDQFPESMEWPETLEEDTRDLLDKLAQSKPEGSKELNELKENVLLIVRSRDFTEDEDLTDELVETATKAVKAYENTRVAHDRTDQPKVTNSGGKDKRHLAGGRVQMDALFPDGTTATSYRTGDFVGSRYSIKQMSDKRALQEGFGQEEQKRRWAQLAPQITNLNERVEAVGKGEDAIDETISDDSGNEYKNSLPSVIPTKGTAGENSLPRHAMRTKVDKMSEAAKRLMKDKYYQALISTEAYKERVRAQKPRKV